MSGVHSVVERRLKSFGSFYRSRCECNVHRSFQRTQLHEWWKYVRGRAIVNGNITMKTWGMMRMLAPYVLAGIVLAVVLAGMCDILSLKIRQPEVSASM